MNTSKNIYTHIRNSISNGVYKPGDALPSENSLALQFRVNKRTVSKAFGLLQSESFIVKAQGKPARVSNTHCSLQKTISIAVADERLYGLLLPVHKDFSTATGLSTRTDILKLSNGCKSGIDEIKHYDFYIGEAYCAPWFYYQNLLTDLHESPCASVLLKNNTIMRSLATNMQIAGAQTGLPCFFSPLVVICNTGLCNQAGIIPPKHFSTLASLTDTASKISRTLGREYCGLTCGNGGGRWPWFHLYFHKKESFDNSAEVITTLKKMRAMHGREIYFCPYEVSRNIFSMQHAAMYVSTYYDLAHIRRQHFPIALSSLPAPNLRVYTSLFVFKNVPSPVREAYLDFFYSLSTQERLRKSGSGIPVIDKAARRRESPDDPRNYRCFTDSITHSFDVTTLSNDKHFLAIQEKIDLFWNGFISAETLVKNAYSLQK